MGIASAFLLHEPTSIMADTKRTKSKSEWEHKHKRKHRSDKEGSSKKARKEDGEHIHILDESANDDDMWEEKNIDMDGEKVRS